MKEKKLLLVFILITFIVNIQIPFLQTFNFMNKLYKLLQIIILFFSLLHFRKISKIFIIIIFYYLIYLISTFLNKGTLFLDIIKSLICAINLIIIMQYYIEKDIKLYIKAGKIFFSAIIIIELITILFFPNGIYYANNVNPHYFLGHRNNTIEYIFPALIFFYYDNIINNSSKGFLKLYSIICLLCVILTWSANSIVALIFTLGYILFPTKKIMQKFIKFIHMFYLSLILLFSFIIFKIQNYFEWFICGILHKSLNFTGRTSIWDKSLYYIKLSPIYGYGNEDEFLKKIKIGHGNSCHNYFLDFLYSGGIIMLFLIIFLIITTHKIVDSDAQNKVINNLNKISIGILGGYLIIWFATPIHLATISYMFLVFAIVYNINILKPKIFKLKEG